MPIDNLGRPSTRDFRFIVGGSIIVTLSTLALFMLMADPRFSTLSIWVRFDAIISTTAVLSIGLVLILFGFYFFRRADTPNLDPDDAPRPRPHGHA